jgi:chaperone BCS1
MRPEKAIILFEDIDCLFDNLNREKSEDEKDDKSKIKITLSCILNILDGAYTPDDVIFILTTNHIDKLDDAIKRDGRADMKLEITKPSTETKQRYLEYVKEQTGQTIPTDLTEDVTLSTLEKFLLQ